MTEYRLLDQDNPIDDYIEILDTTDSNPVVSVVGAGGKSTLIELIAEEYIKQNRSVIITTTTHIRMPDDNQGVCVITEFDGSTGNTGSNKSNNTMCELSKAMTDGRPNRIYVGTAVHENGIHKLKAPGEDIMAKMISERTCPILIEADGAAGKPCKAPADYEPVIRPETDCVIGVISTAAIGGRIGDVCHRPQMVSRLLKKGINDIITSKDLEIILRDSNGLMKGVAQGMKYVPILRVG